MKKIKIVTLSNGLQIEQKTIIKTALFSNKKKTITTYKVLNPI